MSPAQPET